MKSWALVVLSLLILILPNLQGYMVKDDVARRALEIQGFTQIKIEARKNTFVFLRGCSGTDVVKWEMRARNVAGQHVSLYVCAGWLFKGATIRTD